MRLTELVVERLRPPEQGQKTYFDDVVKGLGLRVSQGGSKTFVVMYGEKRQLKTLGRYPAKALKEARSEAMAFISGPKPSPGKITADEANTAFLEHCDQHTSKRTRDDYDRLLNRHFPKGKMSALTRHTLLTKLDGLSATPGEQAHAATAFNVFLNWCVSKGHIQGNPIAGIRGIGRIKKRERLLTDKELVTLYQKAEGYEHPFGNIVRLLILTGQRRSEVANFRRTWIDGDTITIPAAFTKNRLEHTFPIGELTRAVIAGITTNDDRLFKGRGDNIWNGWSKTKLDFDPLKSQWQLHDLRRTFRTKLGKLGVAPHIGERLINHVSTHQSEVQRIYDLYTYLPEMTEATKVYESHLQSLLSAGKVDP